MLLRDAVAPLSSASNVQSRKVIARRAFEHTLLDDSRRVEVQTRWAFWEKGGLSGVSPLLSVNVCGDDGMRHLLFEQLVLTYDLDEDEVEEWIITDDWPAMTEWAGSNPGIVGLLEIVADAVGTAIWFDGYPSTLTDRFRFDGSITSFVRA
jgi:hypothetical protein